MKILIILITFSISLVICEDVFGQRLSASKNTTNKETSKSKKDLSPHESIRTYEFALPPIEVQTRYPKVIAEEHTIHEIIPILKQLKAGLNYGENVDVKQSLPTNKSPLEYLLGPQYVPKHYSQDLPIYQDDPKEVLRGYPMVQTKQSAPVPQIITPINSLPLYNNNVEPTHGVKYRTDIDNDNEDYSSNYGSGLSGIGSKNYPTYHTIPHTTFKCSYMKYPGYYADIEAGCQVWHFCQLDGRHDRFLCPNGTLFNQKTRVCDHWYNVDCHSSLLNYDINSDLYSIPHKNYGPVINPSHEGDLQLIVDQSHEPNSYQKISEPYSASLIFAESKVVPKKIIKRVKKVRINSNNTDIDLNSLKNINNN